MSEDNNSQSTSVSTTTTTSPTPEPKIDIDAVNKQHEAAIVALREETKKQLKEVGEKATEDAVNRVVEALSPKTEKEYHEVHRKFASDPESFVSELKKEVRNEIKRDLVEEKNFLFELETATKPFMEEAPGLAKYDKEYQQALIDIAKNNPEEKSLSKIAEQAANYCIERYKIPRLSDEEIKLNKSFVSTVGSGGQTDNSSANKSSIENFMEQEAKRSLESRGLYFNKTK